MISDKAYIAPGAKIGKNVTIYPFAYIEDDVVIGDDCIIFPYVSIMKGTVMGRGNKVYQNTVLGAEPQDFNYKGDETRLVIGDENIFRENVVVNRATFKDGETRIGNRNFFMEGVHISHDTKIDDYVTFGYGTKVAGDCEIHSAAIFSSGVIINSNVRIGGASMVTSGVRISKDVPRLSSQPTTLYATLALTRLSSSRLEQPRRSSATSPTHTVWCSTDRQASLMPSTRLRSRFLQERKSTAS